MCAKHEEILSICGKYEENVKNIVENMKKYEESMKEYDGTWGK